MDRRRFVRPRRPLVGGEGMISAAITEALERIRAREGQPGYEGPKITSYIRNVAAIQYLMVRGGGDFMPKVTEDAIVGAVGRACIKMGWGSTNNGESADGYQYAIMEPGKSDDCIIAIKCSPSAALAALLAWEAAIGGGEKDE